jgi:hypothetical protein
VTHSKLFFVQNNPLYEGDDDGDLDQQSTHEKHSEPTLDASVDGDEVVHEQV